LKTIHRFQPIAIITNKYIYIALSNINNPDTTITLPVFNFSGVRVIMGDEKQEGECQASRMREGAIRSGAGYATSGSRTTQKKIGADIVVRP